MRQFFALSPNSPRHSKKDAATPMSTMFLWTLVLIVTSTGSFIGAYGKCPPDQSISPCTCRVISDKYGEDFALLSCKKLHSEDVLLQILAAAKGEKLFELQIVDSVLRYIPHNAFQDTTFEVISFENSSISALSDTGVAFDGLQDSLRLLEIVNCSFLSNWDWTQLSQLKHLMEIVVQQSDLLDITNGLTTVQHLEFEAFVLKENNIEWLDSHVFAPFQLLARVTLDKNHIQNLERTMFPRPANHLKILGLSYNKLRYLPKDMFVDMPALSSLYLTGNPLQIIDETVFRPIWNQIKLFFFYDTILSCDCRLAWITKMDNSQKFMHAVCHSPANARGRHLISMQSHELWC